MSATAIPLHEEMRAAALVAAKIIEAGIDPDDPDYVEILAGETDVLDRLRRIVRAARWTEAQAKGLGEMIAEMGERKTRLEAKAKRLRGIVHQMLDELGLKRLDAPDFTASIQAPRKKLLVTDEKAIPAGFFVITRALDRKALAAALADVSVEGAELVAGEPSLTVRVR